MEGATRAWRQQFADISSSVPVEPCCDLSHRQDRAWNTCVDEDNYKGIEEDGRALVSIQGVGPEVLAFSEAVI